MVTTTESRRQARSTCSTGGLAYNVRTSPGSDGKLYQRLNSDETSGLSLGSDKILSLEISIVLVRLSESMILIWDYFSCMYLYYYVLYIVVLNADTYKRM